MDKELVYSMLLLTYQDMIKSEKLPEVWSKYRIEDQIILLNKALELEKSLEEIIEKNL